MHRQWFQTLLGPSGQRDRPRLSPSGVLWRLRWAVIVGLPLLAAVLAHALFLPQYQSNDDVGMLMLAAGAGLGAEPSPYLLFMNPLLGQLLSGLYRLAPDVAWYCAFMVGVRALAGMALGAAVLAHKPSVGRVLLLSAYFLTVDIAGHAFPQFSLTASAAAQGAVALWLVRGPGRGWSPAALAAFLGLLGLAVLIRPDHAAIILVLSAPLAVADAWAALRGRLHGDPCPTARRRLGAWACRTGLPFLGAGAVTAGLMGYFLWFYATSPGWHGFYRYNWLRAQITDYARDEGPAEPALHKAGWSANDLYLLKTFFFADRETYSAARLRAYLRARPSRPPSLPPLRGLLRASWDNPLVRLFLAAALFPALFVTGLRRGFCYGGVCVAVTAVWLMAGGVFRHYCPQHFVQSMLAFAAAVGLVLAAPVRSRAAPFIGWVVGAIVFGLAGAQGAGYLYERSRSVAAARAELHKEIRALNPRPEQLYVVWGACFPLEYLLPFDSLGEWRRFKMFGLGCAANTPLMDKHLQARGIPDLVTGLYGREDVFLVCTENLIPLLRTFIAEHRGVDVDYRVVFDPPQGLFKVFQLRPKTPTAYAPALEGGLPSP